MTNRMPTAADVEEAAANFPRDLIAITPLLHHQDLSDEFEATIFLKDETRQPIRSYKGRGSYNAIRQLNGRRTEIVCASAGNHAQGVASACNYLQRKARIFMARITSPLKIEATKRHGNGNVEVILEGDDFDEAKKAAIEYAEAHDAAFIDAFDDPNVIAGQGTVGLEIAQQAAAMGHDIDIVVGPVGGGGLMSGIGTYFHEKSPRTRLIGVEAKEAAAMRASWDAGHPITLGKMSPFIDGAAVRRPGDLTFTIAKRTLNDIVTVPENRVCSTFLELDQRHGIRAELAGVLSIDALRDMRDDIRGKTVACIVSGSNIDMKKISEILRRADLYKGLKRDLRIYLPNRPDALCEVTDHIRGQGINIAAIHYEENGNGEREPMYIELSCTKPGILDNLATRLKEHSYEVDDVSQNAMVKDIL